ncbi:MAG: hypothetical protein IH948_05905 [Bacteroidetes bacterium]|nr:hypothetical protein [Bacteroidota bacterium]
MNKTPFLLLCLAIILTSNITLAQIIIEKDIKEINLDNEEKIFSQVMEAYGSGSMVSEKFRKFEPPNEILSVFNAKRPNEVPTHWALIYTKGAKENLVYHASFGTSEKDDGAVIIDASGNWIGTKYFDEHWHYPASSWSRVKKTVAGLRLRVTFDEYITFEKPDGFYCIYRCVRDDNVVIKIEFNEQGQEIRLQQISNL